MLLSDLKILIPDYISIFALMFFFIVLKERILVKRGCIERKWNVLRFAVNSIKFLMWYYALCNIYTVLSYSFYN